MPNLIEIISEECRNLNDGYHRRAESLKYDISASYNVTLLEQEGLGEIYVLAEYKNPLRETKENKSKLRKLIPKKIENEYLSITVKIEYVELPKSVKKTLKAQS